MVNKKHEEFEKRNEKWRIASSKAIDLRYALDDILSSFTEEEKQTIRYRQFVETISQQYDHLLGDINRNKQEEIKSQYERKVLTITKKNGWLSYKSAIIAAVGAIAVKAVEIIPQVITALTGGTP